MEAKPKTTLAYEVFTFMCPSVDRDLSVKVNDLVRGVRGWAGHMGPVRVSSLSNSSTNARNSLCTLTIEYTAYDSSKGKSLDTTSATTTIDEKYLVSDKEAASIVESEGCSDAFWKLRDLYETKVEKVRIIDKERIAALESFARDIRDNWDCDNDGHKYDTGCRKCDASVLLNQPVTT